MLRPKHDSPRSRITARLCTGALLFWLLGEALLWEARLTAQQHHQLTAHETRGKLIYRTGASDAGNEIKAVFGSAGGALPATSFPCVNCHGRRGEGAQEGGLQPPPLTWRALTTPGRSPLTDRSRNAYDQNSLARAIRQGIDPAGRSLHPGMPRYQLNEAQMRALVSYLKIIGTAADAEPGVSETSIKLGAVLPLSGPFAWLGADVKTTLSACLAEINARGGVYGRRFELLVADAGGDSAQTIDATRRLVEQDEVLALLANFEPPEYAASTAIAEWLQANETLLIGPLTLAPRMPDVPNRAVFYLAPDVPTQACALLDFVAERMTPASPIRLALLSVASAFDEKALQQFRQHAQTRAIQLVYTHTYAADSGPRLSLPPSLITAPPDFIFVFAPATDFLALAKEIDQKNLPIALLGSAAALGTAVSQMPPAVAARTYLMSPVAVPGIIAHPPFETLIRETGLSPRSTALQAIAYAAAQTLIEATKQNGRQLDRHSLLKTLERMQDFSTGVLPPLSFNANRRIGATGVFVLSYDLAERRWVNARTRRTVKP